MFKKAVQKNIELKISEKDTMHTQKTKTMK